MKAIIVDDEPKAIELLKSYLAHFSKIELAATFRNGLKALEYLSNENTDLVFLDINMPHISGISVSKLIKPETKIIFTTAYSEYAVESYEVEAVDYLLKPISLERFGKAMSKILVADEAAEVAATDVLLIKSGHRTHRVQSDDILYLEKDGNYITYHLQDRHILARETVNEALSKLPPNFIQTHKSYVVNTDKISSLDKEFIQIAEFEIPIGATFSEKIKNRLFSK